MDFLHFLGRCIWNSFQVASGAFGYIELLGALCVGLAKIFKKRLSGKHEEALVKVGVIIFALSFVISVLFVAPYEEYRDRDLEAKRAAFEAEQAHKELEQERRKPVEPHFTVETTDQEARDRLAETRAQLSETQKQLALANEKIKENARDPYIAEKSLVSLNKSAGGFYETTFHMLIINYKGGMPIYCKALGFVKMTFSQGKMVLRQSDKGFESGSATEVTVTTSVRVNESDITISLQP